jgi:hypothetical protein
VSGLRRSWAFSKVVRWRVVVLVAGVCALLLVEGSAARASPRAAGARIAWHDCGDQLQCARVRVPLDWSRPRGRKISLALTGHLASNQCRADRLDVHQPRRAG